MTPNSRTSCQDSEVDDPHDSIALHPMPDDWPKSRKKLKKSDAVDKLQRLFIPFGVRGRDEPQSSLHWLLPPVLNESQILNRIETWQIATVTGKRAKSSTVDICESVSQLNPARMNLEAAFVALGAIHALRMCTVQLDELEGWQLIALLERTVNEISLDLGDDPWLTQLCCVEMPLALAFQLKGVAKSTPNCKKVIKLMERQVADVLDGNGWPKFAVLPEFGPLIVSWARSSAIAKQLELKIARDPAYQLEWAARQVIRLLRPNGTLMASDHKSNSITNCCIQTVLSLSADKLDQKVADKALNFGSKRTRRNGAMPEESCLSEWAAVGVFQRDWERNSSKCAFHFGDGQFWWEINRKTTLLAGECTPQISRNGSILKKDAKFELVCDHIGTDIDYLELELEFEDGVKLQRHLVFGKTDQFLLLADVIVSPQPARLDYRCELPLGPEMSGLAEIETREVYLQQSKIRALVLPLALPEWKIARTDDYLDCEDNRMILSQSNDGCGLFAGLFMDLNPNRSLKPRTWRALTVAESLKIVDRDCAVAFRIQIGSDQWVVYRSLAKNGNRTFLGENTTSEFFVGRFESNGEISELLQIE